MLINKWNVTSYGSNSWIRRFIGLTGQTQGSNGQCQWIYPKHFYADSWRKSCWQLTSKIDIENIHKWYCIICARNTHNRGMPPKFSQTFCTACTQYEIRLLTSCQGSVNKAMSVWTGTNRSCEQMSFVFFILDVLSLKEKGNSKVIFLQEQIIDAQTSNLY